MSAGVKIVERWKSQSVWDRKICSTRFGGGMYFIKTGGVFFLNCGVSEVCFFYWAGLSYVKRAEPILTLPIHLNKGLFAHYILCDCYIDTFLLNLSRTSSVLS